MKIREGFVRRKVAGQYVVVAIGPASKILNGMIKLNETGAFCWDYLLKGISEDELGGWFVLSTTSPGSRPRRM